MTTQILSQPQLHALLDILSHDEMYTEIQDFRKPGTLSTYGPPFTSEPKGSTSPSLQTLFSKFILTLPGLRNVSQEYWTERVVAIVEDLEKAELSESYDKGSIGMRKTVATAISSLIEYPARGVQAGFDPPAGGKGRGDQFDLTNAEDLQHSFRQLAKLMIYDDMLQELFTKVEETDNLDDHTSMVQAAHECILVNLASFMHYTLILSPKGQGLLKLIDQTNRMVPYMIIKSTLKIGNVATMISSMLKVVLAKVSMSTVTNWVGWTKDADEGMNLMQTIISAVLGWDSREFKSRASKIEKSKDAPSKEQLAELKSYQSKSREEHDSIREFSEKESKSIAYAILSAGGVSTDLTESQHTQALEYLAATLAVRDRECIVQVLCHSNPDNLTQAVRDVVASYDPIIRNMHKAVDLSDTVNDCERFIDDTIKLAKLPDSVHGPLMQLVPTVGDFVQLLKKHQHSLHKFLHQVCKNGPELRDRFHDWAIDALKQFRQSNPSANEEEVKSKGTGDLTQHLKDLYASLPAEKQEELTPKLDAHAKHLSLLQESSVARLRAVLQSSPSNHSALSGSSKPSLSSATPQASRASSQRREDTSRSQAETRKTSIDPGPGAFLAKWQSLLDSTSLTPAQAEGGAVRNGGISDAARSSTANDGTAAAEHQETSPEAAARVGQDANDSDDGDDAFEDAVEKLETFGIPAGQQQQSSQGQHDVAAVVAALGPAYRRLLGELNGSI